MLVTASWVERVKHLTGLKAVSQIWGQKPAWYFWINNMSGAYSLQLENSATEKRDDLNWHNGNFSIKYYPHPREEVFTTFSFQEQCFANSEYFDRTQTPRPEDKEKIPATLFNVATMEYSTGPDDDAPAILSLTSLDALRMSWKQETVQKYSMFPEEKIFKRGDTDRNVPGWELGLGMFDRLLSLYSFYSKAKPLRVVMTRSAGFEYVCDPTHGWQCEDSSDLNMYSLNVFFVPETQKVDRSVEDMLDRRCFGEGQELLYEREFLCGHLHSTTDQFPKPVFLNALWWSLAESDYKSELASTCGCA
jgi:hypothetical protein